MTLEQRQSLEVLIRSWSLDLGGDVLVQRPLMEQMMTSHPLAEDVQLCRGELGGVPVVTVDVDDCDTDAILFYLHGGAYAMGTATAAAALTSDLARRAKTRAISVDYRLAPEHPFPAAVDDALAAYLGLIDGGIDPRRVVLAGESAGAGLAVALLVATRDLQAAMPTAAVLLSPWIDLGLTGVSASTRGGADPVLTFEALRRRSIDYLGGKDPATPLASPIYANLKGLPPLHIEVGSAELLLDDAIRLASTAAHFDVQVNLHVTPGVPHVFPAFAAILDEGGAALDRAGHFLRAALRTSRPT